MSDRNKKARVSNLDNKSALSWFFTRREPYYHKLQYSKTPKFDVAAAVFGAILSAFIGYLALNSLGSGGADLSDLATLFWYTFLAYRIVLLIVFLAKDSISFFLNPLFCFLRAMLGGLAKRFY